MGDDARWRAVLRGLQSEFRHQTITGRDVERYIARHADLDLAPIFDQYLRTTQIPTLEYRTEGSTLFYRWADVVQDFAMRLPATLTADGVFTSLRPTTAWQTTQATLPGGALKVDPNYYVRVRRLEPGR